MIINNSFATTTCFDNSLAIAHADIIPTTGGHLYARQRNNLVMTGAKRSADTYFFNPVTRLNVTLQFSRIIDAEGIVEPIDKGIEFLLLHVGVRFQQNETLSIPGRSRKPRNTGLSQQVRFLPVHRDILQHPETASLLDFGGIPIILRHD